MQKYSPVSGYNRICWVMNSSTNLNMFSTHSALWKWTMTDKHWAVNTLQHNSRQEGRVSTDILHVLPACLCVWLHRRMMHMSAASNSLTSHTMQWCGSILQVHCDITLGCGYRCLVLSYSLNIMHSWSLSSNEKTVFPLMTMMKNYWYFNIMLTRVKCLYKYPISFLLKRKNLPARDERKLRKI